MLIRCKFLHGCCPLVVRCRGMHVTRVCRCLADTGTCTWVDCLLRVHGRQPLIWASSWRGRQTQLIAGLKLTLVCCRDVHSQREARERLWPFLAADKKQHEKDGLSTLRELLSEMVWSLSHRKRSLRLPRAFRSRGRYDHKRDASPYEVTTHLGSEKKRRFSSPPLVVEILYFAKHCSRTGQENDLMAEYMQDRMKLWILICRISSLRKQTMFLGWFSFEDSATKCGNHVSKGAVLSIVFTRKTEKRSFQNSRQGFVI